MCAHDKIEALSFGFQGLNIHLRTQGEPRLRAFFRSRYSKVAGCLRGAYCRKASSRTQGANV